MKVAAFPAAAAFLPALASAWLADGGDPGRGLIILPSRRAARAAAGAFLQAHGRALLLPRIIAAGALDEAGLALSGALDLPPAMPAMTRQAMLAQLILARDGAQGAPRRLPGAWALAGDLAALLDEAAVAEVDLAAALPGVVAAELAAHWQTTLQFLEIVTAAWPAILAAAGMIDPAARQARLMDAQAAAWLANPPPEKIWLVAREASPALARLARVVADLPQGVVILPGYDAALDEAAWEALDDGHAQAGIARLLGALGARRAEIAAWPAPAVVPAGRAALLSRALLPAAALGAWQDPGPHDTAGLYRLAARDEQEDAAAIAMVLRDALQTPGRSVALITPDRALALRVAAALRRFGIAADDSAGTPLADTPPAIFLRLLAQAAAADYAPLPLLALLKHPLAAAGLPPANARELARRLERQALRGPRPPPGLEGLNFRLARHGTQDTRDFLDRLAPRLAFLALPAALNPAEALRQLLTAGEALAATEAAPGAAELWAGEAGVALSERLTEALAALSALPDIAAADLPDLLDAILAGAVVRRPRTRDNHPRIAIWGVREAELQTVDVAVLAGLTEGVWPGAAEPGPWLSRPMRKAAGLPAPEAAIGRAAHDFFALCGRCPVVVLAAPIRRDRAPAVPARWLTRLEALLGLPGLAHHPAESWARQLDLPATRAARAKPRPRPAAAHRPKKLSISEITTLIADPYAIYAGKILGIRELPPLDEESDPALFGNIVHAGLAAFHAAGPDVFAPGAENVLALALHTALRAERPRAALQTWWETRLERIAAWIIAAEAARQERHGPPVHVALEAKGECLLPGGFLLHGRADRIERRADGKLFIADYKTGTPPSAKQVQYGSAPQLPLEAVLAEVGGFGPEFQAETAELAYWQLSGRSRIGEEKPLFEDDPAKLRDIIATAAANLPELFATFANPATPYLAAPHPDRGTYRDTYAGLSRRGEWGDA